MKYWTLIPLIFLSACLGDIVSQPTPPLIDVSKPTFTPQSIISNSPISPGTKQPVTLTPLPTLSIEEKTDLISGLILDNGGCKLPCFWGIIPGLDEWEPTKLFLTKFAEIREGKYFSIKVQDPEDDRVNLIEFKVQDGIIVEIIAGPPITRNFTIDKILVDYGQPEGIYILTYKNAPVSPVPALLVLSYQRQGILVEYEFASEKINNSEFLICSQPIGPNMWLRNSQQILTELEINRSVLGSEPSYTLRKVDDVSDIGVDEFFDKFKKSSACLITPIDIWP